MVQKYPVLLAMASAIPLAVASNPLNNITNFKDMDFLKDVVEFANVNAQQSVPRTEQDDYVTKNGDADYLDDYLDGYLDDDYHRGYSSDGSCSDDDHDPGFLRKQKSKLKGKKKFHGDTGIFFDIGIGLAAGSKGKKKGGYGSDDEFQSFGFNSSAMGNRTFSENLATVQGKPQPERPKSIDSLDRPKKKTKKLPKLEIGTGLFLDLEVEKGKKHAEAECEGDYCLSDGSDNSLHDHEHDTDCESDKDDSAKQFVQAKGLRKGGPRGSRRYRAESERSKASNRRKAQQQAYSSGSDNDSDLEDDEESSKFWFWPLGVKANGLELNILPSEVNGRMEVDSSRLVSKSAAETHNLLSVSKENDGNYNIPSNHYSLQKQAVYVVSASSDKLRKHMGSENRDAKSPEKASSNFSIESSGDHFVVKVPMGMSGRKNQTRTKVSLRESFGKGSGLEYGKLKAITSFSNSSKNNTHRTIDWNNLYKGSGEYPNPAPKVEVSTLVVAMCFAISGLF